jgi:hypothetical protein
MNMQEAAALLTKIQIGDNREITELVIREWHDTIGHLNYAESIAAVKLHRQESTEYLMPAHVIRNVRRLEERTLPPRFEITAGECAHVFKGGWCVHCPTEDPEWTTE